MFHTMRVAKNSNWGTNQSPGPCGQPFDVDVGLLVLVSILDPPLRDIASPLTDVQQVQSDTLWDSKLLRQALACLLHSLGTHKPKPQVSIQESSKHNVFYLHNAKHDRHKSKNFTKIRTNQLDNCFELSGDACICGPVDTCSHMYVLWAEDKELKLPSSTIRSAFFRVDQTLRCWAENSFSCSARKVSHGKWSDT